MMFVIVEMDGYDGPEAIGPYPSEQEAHDALYAWWVKCEVAKTTSEARNLYIHSTPGTWIARLTGPYDTKGDEA